MERREFLEVSFGLIASTIIGKSEPKKLVYRLIEADKPNKNGRIYPSHVLQNVVKTWKNNETLGMLNMPTDGIIHFADASHFVKNLELKDGFLQCEIIPLDTPKGKILQKMIENDEVEFRTVGVGDIVWDNAFIIADNYKLTSVNAIKKGTGA